MKCFRFFFAVSFVLFFFGAVCLAQESRSDRRDRGDRGDRGDRSRTGGPGGMSGGPPWMQGGSMGGGPGRMGGGPPWMQGGPMGGGPGGMRGGPPWMGGSPMGGPGGGSDAERNERSLGMLRSMDTNGDGKLDQNEIPEYRRSFVSMIVTRMGGDPNKTINLADLARKASSGSSAQSSSSRSLTGGVSSQTTDPLVPYFGEKETPPTPVIEFGQREAQAKTILAATSGSGAALSQSDQILRSARDIMTKYDKNKNGTLDKDKGEWGNSLPFNADAADKNRDGRVSMSELIAILGGKTGATTGSAAISTRQSAAYDRLPPGMPDWFFEMDKDQDGQITMIEYAKGQPWTEAIADEFRFLDKNNDGVATVTEIFETLKQVDEEKRLKEEQAKRDVERRKGVGGVAAVPPATPPAGQPDGQQPPPPQPGTVASSPPSAPPGAVPQPAGTPAPPPGEPSPNWRPTPPNAVPAAPPSTAPYSAGSSGLSDSDRRRREYQQRSSSGRRGR